MILRYIREVPPLYHQLNSYPAAMPLIPTAPHTADFFIKRQEPSYIEYISDPQKEFRVYTQPE